MGQGHDQHSDLKGQMDSALMGMSLLEENPSTDNAFFLNLAKKTAQKKPLDEGFEPSDILEFKLWMTHQKTLINLPTRFLALALTDKAYKALNPKEKLLMAERGFKELYSLQRDSAKTLSRTWHQRGA